MYCKHCGAQIQETDKFCPVCGGKQIEEVKAEEVKVETVEVGQTAEQTEAPAGLNVNDLLTKGILATAFACTGCISFLGIIFGVICNNAVKTFLAAGGKLQGKAKVGSILGKVGLGVGIGMTVFMFFYFLFIVVLSVAGATHHTNFY